MKTKELRLLNELDIKNKLKELNKEMMKTNQQIAVGTIPKNPSIIKEIRRTIAKILTIKKHKGGNKKE